MQVLIKIDEARFKDIQRIAEVQMDRRTDTVEQLIAKGTPLPKGHGRLIDADEIQFENTEFDTYGDYCIAFDAIDQADTIIKAEHESESK